MLCISTCNRNPLILEIVLYLMCRDLKNSFFQSVLIREVPIIITQNIANLFATVATLTIKCTDIDSPKVCLIN